MDSRYSMEGRYSMEYRETLMLLLQRRYSILQDLFKLTEELQESYIREDTLSFELLLPMRGKLLQDYEESRLAVAALGEQGETAKALIRRLLLTPIPEVQPENGLERKMLELRKRIQEILDKTKELDRMLSLRVGQKHSFYAG